MSGKEAFQTLPRELRAMALAGHYLQSFALMEADLNEAIGAGLKLSKLQEVVVCKNIQLRDKINIARTMVQIAIYDSDLRQTYDKTLTRIMTISGDRNMVAHDVFGPDEDGDGVDFLVTKAKGKLDFPKTAWSIDEVEAKHDELMGLRERLHKLKREFLRHDIIKALMERQADAPPSPTMTGLFSLGSAALADLQASSPPDSSSQETEDAISPEAPQKPQK